MIVDSLESFEKYCDIEDGFQKVYSFIKSHKLAELEEAVFRVKTQLRSIGLVHITLGL